MIDLIQAIQKVLNRSALVDLKSWLEPLPRAAYWHVISDYVFDDPNKHDTASFVLLLHHDKLDTILGYIQNIAPVDIKDSRTASEGLIKYLNSPVAFSFTFVLDDHAKFLSPYASANDMIAQLEELDSLATSMEANSPAVNDYFADARRRFKLFAQELRQKGNQKLARKVFILSAYAAVVLDYLDVVAAPARIGWSSDRDAMIDRHDGVVFDIATIMFYAMKAPRIPKSDSGKPVLLDHPQLIHVQQSASGVNYLDPLIRMADYMAGTIADMALPAFEFSHAKFEAIARGCLLGSANHVLATITWAGDGFIVRRFMAKLTS